ncbi:MAG: hypothetical protein E3J25_10180 [Anaerolineales bacterium]|nr:MAG: hypothetical protein E3J25_10180 [Anaerolineales bacterium]
MMMHRRDAQLLERIVLLLLIIILIAIIARRFPDIASQGRRMAADTELDQVQKAMLAYMLGTASARVEAAACVSDFAVSTPALWPDYLGKRYTVRGSSYSWDERGIVSPCEATAAKPGASPESGD